MSQLLSTKTYKGTRDFYPDEMRIRNWFYSKIKDTLHKYAYEEYNGPMLESFDIYAAKSGEEIADKQTYNFEDKGGRKLAIRPEMTPTVARMVAKKLGELTLPLRWFSIPNLLRYEEPQRGRVREHWQVNVDIFGVPGLEADIEIISIAIDLMKSLNADSNMFKVRINNRKFFNDVLLNVLEIEESNIKAISKIIDKKNKITYEAYKEMLTELGLNNDKITFLDKIFNSKFEDISELIKEDSKGKSELINLFKMIKELDLQDYCIFDFSIIRGFDYYTGTVFEVNDTSEENKRALFGGGRYDNLIEIFKKNVDVSGIGFGFGDVTLNDFLVTHNLLPENLNTNDAILITTFEDVPYSYYIKLSNKLRENNIPNIIYMGNNKKLKKQMIFAEKKNISKILIIGMNEYEKKKIKIKQLDTGEENIMDIDSLIENLQKINLI